MRIKPGLIIGSLLCLRMLPVNASDIVVRDADSVWGDSLIYSSEVVNLASVVSARVVVQYSSAIYSSELSDVPPALDSLAALLPSSRRIVVNYASSTYRLDLLPQPPVAVGQDAGADNLSKEFRLFQNYPNPFNATTTIRFDLPRRSYVKLTVYDVAGRKVTTLVDKELQPGEYKVDLRANDLASGLYLYRLEAAQFVDTRKLMLLK